jgi:hypothetical protein
MDRRKCKRMQYCSVVYPILTSESNPIIKEKYFGFHSALVMINEELFERTVTAPV